MDEVKLAQPKSFLKDNWLILVAIVYLLVPTDLIPDFLPFFGKLDDTTLIVIDLIKRHLDSKKINEKN